MSATFRSQSITRKNAAKIFTIKNAAVHKKPHCHFQKLQVWWISDMPQCVQNLANTITRRECWCNYHCKAETSMYNSLINIRILSREKTLLTYIWNYGKQLIHTCMNWTDCAKFSISEHMHVTILNWILYIGV